LKHHIIGGWLLLCSGLLWGQSSPYKNWDRLLEQAGRTYYEQKQDSSLQMCLQLLKEVTPTAEHRYLAEVYDVIALNFSEFAAYEQTMRYFRLAAKEAALTHNDTIQIWVYSNTANVITSRYKRYREGIQCYQKALYYAYKIKNLTEVSYIKLNMAETFLELKQPQKAVALLRPMIDKPVVTLDREATYTLYVLMGEYWLTQQQAQRALDYFQKAEQLFDKKEPMIFLDNANKVYRLKALAHEKLRQFEAAAHAWRLYAQGIQSIYDRHVLQKAKFLGYQIEIKNFEKQLKASELERKEKSEELRANQLMLALIWGVVVVIALVLIAFIFIAKYRADKNKTLQKLNAELQQAKDEAEKANQMKSQFVSTITHELRTPLYGITGTTDVLLEEQPELAQNPTLQSLRFSARYLLSLVNDLLHINKIEENKLQLKPTAFDLRTELSHIVNSMQHMAEAHQNKLEWTCAPEVPDTLYADTIRLSQILINLLSNSLKFTHQGRILLTVHALEVSPNQAKIQFEVIDNGVGIAPENQQRIFEKFIQIERRSGDYQGTGLGLPIVRRLLNLMNSEIHLESKVGEGTRFWFVLDLDRFNTPELGTAASPSAPPVDYAAGNWRVLVVDDNPINRLVTEKALLSLGIQAVVKPDGLSALEAAQETDFDLVFMDLNMPGMSGFEAAVQLRHTGVGCPIIALTAFDKNEKWDAIKQAGMDDVLVKPFDKKVLVQILNKYLHPTAPPTS